MHDRSALGIREGEGICHGKHPTMMGMKRLFALLFTKPAIIEGECSHN